MTIKPSLNPRIALLTAVLLMMMATLPPGPAVRADTGDSVDLSQVNWDEEETTAAVSETGEQDLSSVNWDEEEDTENAEAYGGIDLSSENLKDEDTPDDAGSGDELQMIGKEDLEKIEARERLTHISGFFLFMGYIAGGILTAFFTRKSKLAIDYPPELLILLHTLWPLELLLAPFFRAHPR